MWGDKRINTCIAMTMFFARSGCLASLALIQQDACKCTFPHGNLLITARQTAGTSSFPPIKRYCRVLWLLAYSSGHLSLQPCDCWWHRSRHSSFSIKPVKISEYISTEHPPTHLYFPPEKEAPALPLSGSTRRFPMNYIHISMDAHRGASPSIDWAGAAELNNFFSS